MSTYNIQQPKNKTHHLGNGGIYLYILSYSLKDTHQFALTGFFILSSKLNTPPLTVMDRPYRKEKKYNKKGFNFVHSRMFSI